MKFVSVRGGDKRYSLEEAVLTGYANDGGMILPEEIPQVSKATLRSWSQLTFQALFVEILSLFTRDDIPREDLRSIVYKSFDTFGIPEAVKLKKLSSKKSIHVCELWHGPTLAFKDLSNRFLGQLLQYFLEKRNEHTFVLVGTSGDTGSSAIEAVKGSDNVDIIVLYPGGGRISYVQELQMVSVNAHNVHVFDCDGTSDDLDVPLTQVYNDKEFNKKYSFGSMNSINIGRILAQTVHYFYCSLQMEPGCEKEVSFVIPTGACGNLSSGMIAKKMGAPIATLCAAVNVNDIVYRFINSGDLTPPESVVQTHSSAMDIGVPYNIERILWLASNGDGNFVRNFMNTFEKEGRNQLAPEQVKLLKDFGLRSRKVDQVDAMAQLRKVWETDKYLLCPHTAVAVNVAYLDDSPAKTHSVGCLATAHPIKFSEAICESISLPKGGKEVLELVGENPPNHSTITALLNTIKATKTLPKKDKYFRLGDDWTEQVKDIISSIAERKKTRSRL